MLAPVRVWALRGSAPHHVDLPRVWNSRAQSKRNLAPRGSVPRIYQDSFGAWCSKEDPSCGHSGPRWLGLLRQASALPPLVYSVPTFHKLLGVLFVDRGVLRTRQTLLLGLGPVEAQRLEPGPRPRLVWTPGLVLVSPVRSLEPLGLDPCASLGPCLEALGSLQCSVGQCIIA